MPNRCGFKDAFGVQCEAELDEDGNCPAWKVEPAITQGERDWTRMTTTVFITSNPDLKARFLRLYENDTHADDVAYWKFNYAQTQVFARRTEKRIAKLERKLLKRDIKLAKQRVFDLESALDRMENPYGY